MNGLFPLTPLHKYHPKLKLFQSFDISLYIRTMYFSNEDFKSLLPSLSLTLNVEPRTCKWLQVANDRFTI